VGAGCLYNRDQLEGWKKVVDGVHAKGGKIFVQLIHCGRVSHADKQEGLPVVAPSPIAVREPIRDMPGVDYPVPKEMTLEEIEASLKEYDTSVQYAKEAGFDGVQLHAAHGYLVHTFLSSVTNLRVDAYGGTPEKRTRYTLELIDITLKHFPPCRVGIKLSPVSRMKDMYDETPVETYTILLKELEKRKIGFVELKESTELYRMESHYPLTGKEQIPEVCKTFRPFYSGILIANDSFNPESGIAKIREGACDAISFGRLYISNPDLTERILNGWPVNTNWNFKTFFGNELGPVGYTDYPVYSKKTQPQE
jgi:N-ethylmaleimide reductase